MCSTRCDYRVGFPAYSGFKFFDFARNLFDVDYFEKLDVSRGNTGLIVGQLSDPLTCGITFTTIF